MGADLDSWGLDHGAWSVLVHAFPDHSVPVVQLSINANEPLDYHLELGAKLPPLRERGVLIICSGSVAHNLRAMNWSLPDSAFDWARRFVEGTRDQLLDDPGGLAGLDGSPDFDASVPTSDHLVPLLYVAGLAAESSERAAVLTDGFAYGSISMAAYTLGLA